MHNTFAPLQRRRNAFRTASFADVLPSIGLSLGDLTCVVRQFLRAVQSNSTKKNTLKVYWDGGSRRTFKHDTDMERRDVRDQEWEALYEYCLHGTTNKAVSWYDTLFAYPRNRLVFIEHVKYLLTKEGKAQQVYCTEEADPVIAKNAAGKENHYVVGCDSDFFLYKDINYLPLTEFCVSEEDDKTKHVRCPIFRRDALAQSLGLPRGDMLIELALLLGNDYVTDPSSQLVVAGSPTQPNAILKYLQSLAEDDCSFQVQGVSSKDEEALLFVRRLYNHDEEMAQYPLEPLKPNTDQTLRATSERGIGTR